MYVGKILVAADKKTGRFNAARFFIGEDISFPRARQTRYGIGQGKDKLRLPPFCRDVELRRLILLYICSYSWDRLCWN